jgi:hypothetical protein
LADIESEIRTERKRWPVLRTGERAPIDPHKRRLIYIRDGYACQWCGRGTTPDDPAPGRILEVDHVVPWSALGSDRSDNLRSLCAACNEQRSNYVDEPPRLIGVTANCYWCARRHRLLPDHLVGVSPSDMDEIKVYCGRCGSTSWVPSEEWIL